MRQVAVGVLALVAADAHAFCGTYVGGAEGELTNHASQIAVVREGDGNTLTMFNDYAGDLSTFGLVIPVPVGIDAGNVRLADPALLELLDRYSSPREVSYTCDDFYSGDLAVQPATSARESRARSEVGADDDHEDDTGSSASSSSSSSGCGGHGSGPWWDEEVDDDGVIDTATGVEVEDEFDLGEYTAFVLSADGADGLVTWLGENGFAVDEGTQGLLDEYIEGGSHFLALRVDLEAVPPGRDWLSPLQIGYVAEGWSLPIRLGTSASDGVQDLIVYAVTEPWQGAVGVANYPEAPLPEDECMYRAEEVTSFADYYEASWAGATGVPDDPDLVAARGISALSWTQEYSWGSGKCDPCTETGELGPEQVEQLGYSGAQWYGWHFTRLHLRYTPDAVPQDVVFYGSGITDDSQQRYVQYKWELESLLPVCGEVQSSAPGDCYTAEYWSRRAEDRAADEPVDALTYDDAYSACAPLGNAGSAALFLPLVVAWRRRRRS